MLKQGSKRSNSIYLSFFGEQNISLEKQALNDEQNISKMIQRVQELCNLLRDGMPDGNFDPNEWIKQIQLYIKDPNTRLLYSAISYSIFEMSEEQYDDCSFHMFNVVQCASQKFSSGEIDLDSYKAILKFFDHIMLANQQQRVIMQKKNALHDEVQHEIKDEVQAGISAANKDITSQLVGLVALFTAMSFLVFGGIASLDSIFKSVERFVNLESSVLPVLLVAIAWAFCMMNLLFGFMYFVLRLVRPEQFTIRSEKNMVQRYPVVFLTNYILLVLFVVLLSMWFAKCNGIGLSIFNFVVGHSFWSFWIGIGVIIIGLMILGACLLWRYNSKPRLLTQSEKTSKESVKHSKH